MEGSKRTTTSIGRLSSSTKASRKQKRFHLMTEILLSKNISNHFKFIMAPTHGKTSVLRRRNGRVTLPSQKPKNVDNMLF